MGHRANFKWTCTDGCSLLFICSPERQQKKSVCREEYFRGNYFSWDTRGWIFFRFPWNRISCYSFQILKTALGFATNIHHSLHHTERTQMFRSPLIYRFHLRFCCFVEGKVPSSYRLGLQGMSLEQKRTAVWNKWFLVWRTNPGNYV